MVELYVGEGKKLFRVHKTFLVNKIPYFKKMFCGGFAEAATNSATFPEDDEESFDLLIEWVYTGKVRKLESRAIGDLLRTSPSSWAVTKFYALADKLCINELMDGIMNVLISHYKEGTRLPGTSTVEWVYERLGEGSPLRKFVHWSMHYVLTEIRQNNVARRWPLEEIIKCQQKYPDFALDLLTAFRAQTPGERVKDPRQVPLCTFHCHGKDEPCSDKQ